VKLGALLLSAGWFGALLMGVRLGNPTLALALFGAAAVLANLRALRALGPRFTPRPAELAIGLALGLALVGLTRLVFALGQPLLASEVERALAIIDPSLLLLPAVLVVIAAEELIWRGLALEAFGGRAGAVLASSAIYAVAQAPTGSWLVVCAALGLGGTWAAVAAWRRNLWPGLISHAIWTLSTIWGPFV
jgi:membrane protease YdiL (CAAX protease family)